MTFWKEVKFGKNGLIPTIVQDYKTGEVLMLAYMNEESLKKTLETGRTWFWSRSRKEYWCKGETSGNYQYVKEIKYDCDADAILVFVEQVGVACHTGERSCFYRSLVGSRESVVGRRLPTTLEELYQIILSRKEKMPEGSYTTELFKEGLNKILAKIKEESDEVIDAAKNKGDSEVVWETADLLYHLLVLLADKGISLEEIAMELEKRRK